MSPFESGGDEMRVMRLWRQDHPAYPTRGANDMKTKLLRCPFCGSDDVRLMDRRSAIFVQCHSCGVEGPANSCIDGAVREWNTRVPHVEPLT